MGVDPSKYSKELCENIKKIYQVGGDTQTLLRNPKQNLLMQAADKTKSLGSSTCCIVTIDDYLPIIYTTYIGDSRYMILRRKEPPALSSF